MKEHKLKLRAESKGADRYQSLAAVREELK